MAEIIRVNTARLAADSDRVRECIQGMAKNAAAMDLELAAVEEGREEADLAGTIALFRNCIRELHACLGDLENVCIYEEEARSKYERCVGHVDSVIEGIIV